MLVLRATQKVLRQLPPPAESVGDSDTALGDWYVNRIMVGRQPLLMLVSAASLLSALVPAKDVRGLAERVAGIVANRLHALEVPELLVERELLAMESVVVAKTNDRSVLGFMNDFAKSVTYYLDERYSPEASLEEAEALLAQTPCHAGKGLSASFYPAQRAAELLWSRWGGQRKSDGTN